MAKRPAQLDREIAAVLGPRWTMLESNSLLGSSYYRGVFESEAEAVTYASQQASRSRKFASYEVWTGTAQRPGKPTKLIFVGAH
jgi:hypothetical protein